MNELEKQQDADFERMLKANNLTGEKIVGDGRPIILSDLEKTIVYIQTDSDVYRPYTRTSIQDIDVDYDTENELWFNETEFACYDILNKKYVKMKFDDIGNQVFINDHEDGIKQFKEHLDSIETAKEKCPDVDPKTIQDARYRFDLSSAVPSIWETHYMTDFKFENLGDIWNKQFDESQLVEFRNWYMNKIRSERNVAFGELDQLENDAKIADASEQDLNDIDTIKQMFRDIPQTINLDQFTTLPELLSFWPSLLVNTSCPKLDIVKPHFITPSDNDYVQTLLNDIEDLEELKKLLNDVTSEASASGEVIKLIEDRIRQLEARK